MNKLWRPENKIKRKLSRKNLNYDDDICPMCANVGSCKNPCVLLQGVNGKKERVEALFRDENNLDLLKYKNGNEIMAELAENKRMAYESISQLKNLKLRLICAGVWVGISKRDIGQLMNLSGRRIYQIMKK